MLVLTRKAGESVQLFIGDELVAEIVIAKIGGSKTVPDVRIGIQAPKHVIVLRSELTKK